MGLPVNVSRKNLLRATFSMKLLSRHSGAQVPSLSSCFVSQMGSPGEVGGSVHAAVLGGAAGKRAGQGGLQKPPRGAAALTPTSTWSEPRSSCLWSSSK